MTKYIHTLNLMRWYGEYHDDGVYKKDSMFTIFTLIREKQEEQNKINKVIAEQKYPSIDVLMKMCNKKLAKKDAVAKNQDIKVQDVDEDKNNEEGAITHEDSVNHKCSAGNQHLTAAEQDREVINHICDPASISVLKFQKRDNQNMKKMLRLFLGAKKGKVNRVVIPE